MSRIASRPIQDRIQNDVLILRTDDPIENPVTVHVELPYPPQVSPQLGAFYPWLGSKKGHPIIHRLL